MEQESPVNTAIVPWRERATYAILFFLPIAGVSARHWFSTSFLLFVLLALPELWRRPWNLDRRERVLVAILALYFVVFVISALANGWTYDQTHYGGRVLRFLVAIPIYLLLRQLPNAALWLARGCVVGGFVLLGQALFDVYVLHLARAQGIYSPNLLGPVAAFECAFLLVLWQIDRAWRPVMAAAMVACISALALSTSRGGYVGFIGMISVWAAMRFKGWRVAGAFLGLVVLLFVAYGTSSHVRDGVDSAVRQLDEPLPSDIGSDGEALPSVPARLEMWRVSILIFRDHPLLGVGGGNYNKAARVYVEEGRAHPEVIRHSHPHSAYFETLVSMGVFGFAVFLAMLLFPIYVFARGYRSAPETALFGLLHVTGFALFSITDASTILKGNYITVWLIFLLTFFGAHIRATVGHNP